LHDLAAGERSELAAAFRAAAPRSLWNSRIAAERHLDRLLPAAAYRDWSDLDGMHFVLGAAGTGKTALLLRIAAAARGAGRDAAVVSLLPERPARTAFLDAAALLDLPAVVVDRRADWDAAMGVVARRSLVLVDTPCFVSHPEMPWQLLTLPELRRGTSTLHYVVCLHHRAAFIARQLQLAAAHRIHDLALTKVDLAPGIGALLTLQLREPRPIAFVSTSPALATPPGLGTAGLRRACGWSAD
jgi:flagellar biosynthesis GTPase FlhF